MLWYIPVYDTLLFHFSLSFVIKSLTLIIKIDNYKKNNQYYGRIKLVNLGWISVPFVLVFFSFVYLEAQIMNLFRFTTILIW